MEFVGFQHSFPIYFILLIWLGCIALIWLSYAKNQKLGTREKLGLSLLRCMSITILFLLLFNPIFFSSDVKKSPQNVMIFLDNSESMSLTKGEYKGASTYRNVLNKLQELEPQLNVEWYQFGNFIRPSSTVDSLDLTDSDTRLTHAVQQVQSLKEDVQGVLLVTDGIHKSTIDASIEAELTGVPFYVIAMGDTNGVQDVSIVDVQRNSLGYLNTSHEFLVSVQADGYANERVRLSMSDAMGNIIDTTTLFIATNGERLVHPFQVNLEETGLQSFRFSIAELENEWTLMNNELRSSVQVIDDLIDVVHIANQIHPDIRMIRDIMATNPQIRLHSLTLQRTGQFLESDIDTSIRADVIIIHGEPWLDALELREKIGFDLLSKPLIYLHIPSPINRRLLNTSAWEPINTWFSNSVGRFQINVEAVKNESVSIARSWTLNEHPLLADVPNLTGSTPRLSGLLSNPLPMHDVILNARYVGDQENYPAIQVRQFNSNRMVLVSHWNWYQFYQSSRVLEREYIDQLFSNVIYWVNSNPNEDNVQINTTRTSYSVNESVEFNATLLNDSGQPENDASVEILIYQDATLKNSEFQLDGMDTQSIENNEAEKSNNSFELRSNIQLTPSGSGEYAGTIDIDEEGIYSYKAIVRKNGVELHRSSAQFIIQQSNDEFVVTKRDNTLLARIASQTGGVLAEFDELEKLESAMQSNGLFEAVDVLVEEYVYPIQQVFWFIIVLILLGIEWFARKWYGLL